MEEILEIRIRALEEDNERLKAENKRLRKKCGEGTDEESDDNSFEAWTVGSRSSLENDLPPLNLQPQAQDPPPQAQGLQPDAPDIQRQSTLKFRAYGFGLERLEWISRARVDQTQIERVHFYFCTLPCLILLIWSILIKVKKSCEHLPPTPSLEPCASWNPNQIREDDSFLDLSGFDPSLLHSPTIADMSENAYWCFPCAEVWFEKIKAHIERLDNGNRKEAFDKAEDPWKKIKTFSSCEDLKEHIQAVHIFSTQKYQMVCPMQGCSVTNVDIDYHMKKFHGVDGGKAWYCREADLKNGICGCRLHQLDQEPCCASTTYSCIIPGLWLHHLQAHSLSIQLFNHVESLYNELDRRINPISPM